MFFLCQSALFSVFSLYHQNLHSFQIIKSLHFGYVEYECPSHQCCTTWSHDSLRCRAWSNVKNSWEHQYLFTLDTKALTLCGVACAAQTLTRTVYNLQFSSVSTRSPYRALAPAPSGTAPTWRSTGTAGTAAATQRTAPAGRSALASPRGYVLRPSH